MPVASAIPDVTKLGVLWDNDAAGNYKRDTILKEAMKPVYYLLPPTGGGQLKKTVEGAEALINGGSYKTQKDGGEKLQYPVGQDLFSAIQALVFGKSSSKKAQEYFDSGYKQVLPEDAAERNEVRARELPRVVKYTVGKDNNKQEGTVQLSGKEQAAFQQRFLELLPENMEGLDEAAIQRYYKYAEEVAKDEILAAKGIAGYEPPAWI